MNERDWIKSLDRPVSPPSVDVVHSVLADIRRAPADDVPDPFVRLFTLASTLAAVVIAFAAVSQIEDIVSNPIQSLAGSWAMVMQ